MARICWSVRTGGWMVSRVVMAVALCCCGVAYGQQAATVDSPGFFARWAAFYRSDWKPAAPVVTDANAAPAADVEVKRGLASPLSSPPFPSADWSYGGSPVIGEPDGNVYPLMTAINGAKSRTKVYGWIEPAVNGSTSRDRNYPETNDIYSNRFELQQVVVYVERLPDSVQRRHIDFGFHLTAFYGTDYRSTTNKGYFSSQLIDHNRQYGFDRCWSMWMCIFRMWRRG